MNFNNVLYQSFSLPNTFIFHIYSTASLKTKFKLYQSCKQLALKFRYQVDELSYSRLFKDKINLDDAEFSIYDFESSHIPLKVKTLKLDYLLLHDMDKILPHIIISSVENLHICCGDIMFEDFLLFATPALKNLELNHCTLFQRRTTTQEETKSLLKSAYNLERIKLGVRNQVVAFENSKSEPREKKLSEVEFIIYHDDIDVDFVVSFIGTRLAPDGILKLKFFYAYFTMEFLRELDEYCEAQILACKSLPFSFVSSLYSIEFKKL